MTAVLLASALGGCVHASVERTGRLRLGDGSEGRAPILDTRPADSEEVAVLTVDADGAATAERLTRHLQRRASLLGCDGLIQVEIEEKRSARGTCVRRRERVTSAEIAYAVRPASQALRARAASAGAEGAALLAVLDQAERRSEQQKAWPLRWYLDNYPNSPFRADVEALFVVEDAQLVAVGTPQNVRTAPSAE